MYTCVMCDEYVCQIIKQSQIVLSFLAAECCITTQHIDVIWAAAQVLLTTDG